MYNLKLSALNQKANLLAFVAGLLLLQWFKINAGLTARVLDNQPYVYSQLVAQIITLASALGVWMVFERTYGGMPRLGRMTLNQFLYGTATVLVLAWFGMVMMSTLGIPTERHTLSEMELIAKGHILVVFLTGSVLAPIMEELLFRGFMLRGIDDASANAAFLAILGGGLVFSVAHSNYENPTTFIMIALMGVVLGVARFATGGLLLPILLHMIVNGVAFYQAVRIAL